MNKLELNKIKYMSAIGFLNTVLICEADSNMVLCPRDFVNFLTRNRQDDHVPSL